MFVFVEVCCWKVGGRDGSEADIGGKKGTKVMSEGGGWAELYLSRWIFLFRKGWFGLRWNWLGLTDGGGLGIDERIRFDLHVIGSEE